MSGYTDEGGVFVPGLLQNTADAVLLLQSSRKLARHGVFAVFALVGLAILNALHLYGIYDIAKSFLFGAVK